MGILFYYRCCVSIRLHFHLYLVNVHLRLTKSVCQARGKLSELCRHCVVAGVDDDLPQFHIGHPAMFGQRRRYGAFEYSLQF